ncbi:MAG TPA: hypothetical protein VMM93_08740 [Vicinamibacterales bacterium]|nr:hypothetical protein [Vicinamibacterales bacterium]
MPVLLPPSYRLRHGHAVRVELADERPLRERNKLYYRVLHWPVWIFAFFIAPGPITFTLFAEGPNQATLTWLAVVVAGTGAAALAGRLPGVERRPLILRFTEDRPNPIHRRICYTVAWGDIISFASLNAIGIVDALVNGAWRMRAIYDAGYLPIVAGVWLVGAGGWLPRARRSTRGEGYERRYFYGAVWAVTISQLLLWLLWGTLPLGGVFDVVKLVAFLGTLGVVGDMARRGLLPRTRPILPGEVFVSD